MSTRLVPMVFVTTSLHSPRGNYVGERGETPPAGLTAWSIIYYASSGLFTFLWGPSTRQGADQLFRKTEHLTLCGWERLVEYVGLKETIDSRGNLTIIEGW